MDKKNSNKHLKDCLVAYEVMYTTRAMDNKMDILVKQNKGTTFFLSTAGHELVGAVFALEFEKKKDWAFPYYRDRAFAVGLGCDIVEIFGAFLARDVKHHSGGRMMLDHFSHKELNIPTQSSCVGSQFLQAVGLAKGLQMQNKDDVVYVSAGDGATSQGDFHEALNFACIHNLRVIFVIQDNKWAISVPKKEQTAGGSVADICKGYAGLQVIDVDGTDVEKLHDAATKAKAFKGPTVVVAHVARWNPHTNSDDPKKYKDEKTIAEEKTKDPVKILEKYLLENKVISNEELKKIGLNTSLHISPTAGHTIAMDGLEFASECIKKNK